MPKTFILEEVDRVQADAFATDVRDILIAHGDEMEPHHSNTLEALLLVLDSWTDERMGMTARQAYELDRVLSPMPDLIPHWSET